MELSARNLFALFERYKKSVNPFAAVCQCRHETSFQGRPWNSELCLKANNLAGLKAWNGWLGDLYSKNSWEQRPDGTKYEKISNFCRYASVETFAENYARKIERDYSLCAASADNFWGYFSGLFKGRLGAWATDLAYLDRMIDQVLVLGPVLLGRGWAEKCWDALEYAVVKRRLQPGHEERIASRLQAEIPRTLPLFDGPAELGKPGKKLVFVDPGHGDPDPGAVGRNGTKEADVALAVAQRVERELKSAGLRVALTRNTAQRAYADAKKDLNMRARNANGVKADCFVSIHANASVDRTAHGTEVCKYPGSNKGALLADAILRGLVSETGLRSRGLKDRPDLCVLRETEMPAALVELAFLSHPAEEEMLCDPSWQRRAAGAIAAAVVGFLA